jgi:O-antigen ligase
VADLPSPPRETTPWTVVAWLALVAFAVATGGAVHPAAAGAVAGFFLLHALVARVATREEQPRLARWAVTAAVVACAATLVPLPESVRAAIAPGPAAARADLRALGLQGGWAPITVDVGATVSEAVAWVAAGAALALLSRRGGPPRGAAWALGALAVLHGVAWVDLAIGTRVLPLTHIEDPWGVGQEVLRSADFAGWLVNRNHWAALGVVLWPLAVAWAWRTPSPARRFAGTVAASLVVASVVATRSRAGLAVLVLQALAGVVVLALRARGRLRWAALLGFAGAALVAWRVGAAVLERVAAGDVVGRGEIYAATGRMAADSPVLGWGMGSFQAAFPAYQPEGLLYKYSHAHCDPLEWVAGAGVLGLALALGLAGAIVRGARDRGASPLSRTLWTLAVAGGAAAACVEFPLHVPAVRFLWLGVLFAGPPREAA